MKQEEFDFGIRPPKTGGIDKMEFAKVLNSDGSFSEFVYGTYEEVEEYCNTFNKWVDRYLDHVAPHVVQSGLRYVGIGTDPYKKNLGFDYGTHKPIVDDSF